MYFYRTTVINYYLPFAPPRLCASAVKKFNTLFYTGIDKLLDSSTAPQRLRGKKNPILFSKHE
jgi:hypothetical protein